MKENDTMKRTAQNGRSLEERIQALSVLTTRLALAGNLGLSHGGTRDLYGALGYPLDLKSDDLIKQWQRQSIARAIVDRPVKSSWQGDLLITEPEQEKETELEKAFKNLDEQLGLKGKLLRVDRLAQLGDYAILLLGFDDSARDTWAMPVSEGDRDLRYVRPISEVNADMSTFENDPSNPRFGLPRIYNIDLQKPSGTQQDKMTRTSLKVHHSRIIHVAFDLLENEIEGEPVMKANYNRLKDLEKLVGGAAEMFWRGARPGYFGSAKENYSVDSKTEEDLRDQLDEYEHNLRRFLMAEGVDISNLEQQIADPTGHVKIQLQMLSAATNIPLRVLVGSERGEMASTQDRENWKEFLQNRRQEELEPTIVRPFIDRMIQYGALPEPKNSELGYSVVWSDLFTLGEKERAEVGKERAESLAKYVAGGGVAEEFIPLEAFLSHFLKMDEDQVKQIIEIRDAFMEDMLREEAELEQEQEQQQEQEQEQLSQPTTEDEDQEPETDSS